MFSEQYCSAFYWTIQLNNFQWILHSLPILPMDRLAFPSSSIQCKHLPRKHEPNLNDELWWTPRHWLTRQLAGASWRSWLEQSRQCQTEHRSNCDFVKDQTKTVIRLSKKKAKFKILQNFLKFNQVSAEDGQIRLHTRRVIVLSRTFIIMNYLFGKVEKVLSSKFGDSLEIWLKSF